MAPLATTANSSLQRILDFLDRKLEVFELLEPWAHHLDTENIPLISLLCNQIKRTVSQTRELNTKLLSLSLSEELTADPKPSSVSVAVAHARLMDTWDILNFQNMVRCAASDGAPNALFATTYLLDHHDGHHPGACSSYNEDETLCSRTTLRDLISHVGKQTTSSKSWPHSLHPFSTQMEDVLPRISERFPSRYMPAYETLSDTPYTVDPTSMPSDGGSGTVLKVIHKRSHEPFARKSYQNVSATKHKNQISREIDILEVVCHKNIVRLVEAFRIEDGDGSMHLIMTPWAPYTLWKFLFSDETSREKRCPWFLPRGAKSDQVIYRIMYGVADGLDHLHSQHIKHKDLKPHNILLYGEGSDEVTPLITDVGVSKMYVPGGPTNYTDSTFEYLAPEQHEREESSLKSDIWQLGCCFAEILAVSQGGERAVQMLHGSFNKDGKNCGCSIATEHSNFMDALSEICLPGNTALMRAYAVIAAMLDPNPATRIDIKTIKGAIVKLLGKRNA